MGSSFAPSLANLFMARLEEDLILNAEQNPFRSHILMFWQYIDDYFCIFSDPSQLTQFMEWINQIHPSISFTVEGSATEVHFLDTIVYKDDQNKLAVKPYVKPTDKNNYLHFGSLHRIQLRLNIPYGQFLRLKRNVSRDSDFRKHAECLNAQFLARGYPEGIVKSAKQRANQRPRESLFLQWKPEVVSKQLWWALDYTPRAPAILGIIRKHWYLLKDVLGCQNFPQVGLRKTRSLKNFLVKSDMSVKTNKASLPSGHFRCRRCNVCSVMTDTHRVILPDINFDYELRAFSNCNTKFVVYLLECSCLLRYIGSTQRCLHVRIQEHIVRIKTHGKEAPLTQHFLDKRHLPNKMKVVVLESIEAQPSKDHCKLLLQKEMY